MLYACPVLLYIYRLRALGVRQGRMGMANEGLRGDLRVEPISVGWTNRRMLLARLYEPGTEREMLPTIERARVVRVRVALIIAGVEAITRGRKSVEHCRQTWVCTSEPVLLESWPVRPVSRMQATGFDQADDDHA